jgi:hypothetical protein
VKDDLAVDELLNNLVATGALHMLLASAKVSSDVTIDDGGRAINELVVRFPFLKSPYRVTVECFDEPERVIDDQIERI